MGDNKNDITIKDYFKSVAITALGWVCLGLLYAAYIYFSA